MSTNYTDARDGRKRVTGPLLFWLTVMPFLFVGTLFEKGYSETARMIGVAWTVFVVGLWIVGAISSLGASSQKLASPPQVVTAISPNGAADQARLEQLEQAVRAQEAELQAMSEAAAASDAEATARDAAADAARVATSEPGSPVARFGAARVENVDRMTSYAALIGRGSGCGLDMSSKAGRVGDWLDRTVQPGSPDHQTLMMVFMEGSRMEAQAQASGRSPDTCDVVRRAVRNHPWP